MIRPLAAIGLVAVLGACAAEPVWAPDEAVSQARYVPDGPARVTLLTMISNRNGSGGHSALLIDGPERVLFDPAGSWRHPLAPERNDVIYGMTPTLYGFYIDYHARETYHVVVQEVDITPGQAVALIEAVEAYGPVPSAQCSAAVSSVLMRTPGFQSMSRNLFPTRTMQQFSQIPGVRESRVYDDDSDDNYELLNAQAAAAASRELAQAEAN
ncbi:hypothetical protein N8I71_00750 [Roseibacterium sp. SDUM158016]|uniref:hypothetical protein n=1 Tax=Roseicyclus sediminis TaxID=2980997 RepID=UPI0021D18798|nr:hypothetical protein [Roseibacterium sp. SDUM158016]MCU4651344.1 hypothetical protein [Roseibacterium sp. SDUM158016]